MNFRSESIEKLRRRGAGLPRDANRSARDVGAGSEARAASGRNAPSLLPVIRLLPWA